MFTFCAINRLYHPKLDTINRLENPGYKMESTLNPKKTSTDRKKTEVPLLKILVNIIISKVNTNIGRTLTTYDKNTFTKNNIDISDALKIKPVITDKIITNNRLARIKLAIAAILAENNFNRDTGLKRETFIVLLENSPEKTSMLIKTVNKGSNVFISTDRTNIGN